MRSAFLFFVCKAPGTMKSWSMKRFPSHYSQPYVLFKLKARLRSKLKQPQRMLKSNTFCHLVLPMQLLYHLSKALIKWLALESKHLPITTLKQFSSMEHCLQKKMHCTKLECNTVMHPLPPSRVPTCKHSTVCWPYGAEIGSTDNCKLEDGMWWEISAEKSSRIKASMIKYMEVWKRNLFFQKLHTQSNCTHQEMSQSSVAWEKPEQKPRARTWEYNLTPLSQFSIC